jgi:hypothetical protein
LGRGCIAALRPKVSSVVIGDQIRTVSDRLRKARKPRQLLISALAGLPGPARLSLSIHRNT